MRSAPESVASVRPTRPRWRLRPSLPLFGRPRSSFRVCGVTGLIAGASLATVLAAQSGLSHAVNALLLATSIVTFLALALLTKAITGREALIYYHHEVAILTVAAAVLSAFGGPVLPYLDLMALGLGTFLAFGRVGCLMVGCCYGEPHRWGVRYGEEHADAGFPARHVGVTLLPVQAFEAGFVLVLVVSGSVLFLLGRPAGTVLSWYVVSYAAARFWLERLRGDEARPYWRGFSEAQWTSLVLISAVGLAEWQGRLPFSPWHAALGASVPLGMAALVLRVRIRVLLKRRRRAALRARAARRSSRREGSAPARGAARRSRPSRAAGG